MILFFDTETAGLPVNYKAPITDLKNWPRLVQLGWILTNNDGKEIAQGTPIIKPDGFKIPIGATEVHGITNELAYNKGVDLHDALDIFVAAGELADLIVAHNIKFDEKIVGAELHRCAFNFDFEDTDTLCTMMSSTAYCNIPGRWGKPKWPKLQELYKVLFEREFSGAHDAGADIRATKDCFFELKKLGIIKIPDYGKGE